MAHIPAKAFINTPVPYKSQPHYIVVGYERNRYRGGFVVKDINAPWGTFVADFPDGDTDANRAKAQAHADKLNAERHTAYLPFMQSD